MLLILQIFSLYFLTLKIHSLQKIVDDNLFSLEKKVDGNYIDGFNIKRSLSSNLLSLESHQSQLSEQLSLVQASTSADFSGIAGSAILSVVSVATDVVQRSGVFISHDGYLVTNAHVLAKGTYADVITYDKQTYRADLVGYDTAQDIALLKVNASTQPLILGDSDEAKIGEKVIAIGNPLGLSFTTTEGIVSAVHRVGPNEQPAYIQTDVSLNPGNSGGPLIDSRGKVIGINNFKLSNAESIGFALESNYIKNTVNEISSHALNATLV